MPTRIHLTNGKTVDVAEDAGGVASRLGESRGAHPVRFDVPVGDDVTATYVYSIQVTHFEETPPFDDGR